MISFKKYCLETPARKERKDKSELSSTEKLVTELITELLRLELQRGTKNVKTQ